MAGLGEGGTLGSAGSAGQTSSVQELIKKFENSARRSLLRLSTKK